MRVPRLAGVFAAFVIILCATSTTDASSWGGGCQTSHGVTVCLTYEDMGGGLSSMHYWFTYESNYVYGPYENGGWVQFLLCGTDEDAYPQYGCGLALYQSPVTLGGSSPVYTYSTYSTWGGYHAEVHTEGLVGPNEADSPGLGFSTP